MPEALPDPEALNHEYVDLATLEESNRTFGPGGNGSLVFSVGGQDRQVDFTVAAAREGAVLVLRFTDSIEVDENGDQPTLSIPLLKPDTKNNLADIVNGGLRYYLGIKEPVPVPVLGIALDMQEDQPTVTFAQPEVDPLTSPIKIKVNELDVSELLNAAVDTTELGEELRFFGRLEAIAGNREGITIQHPPFRLKGLKTVQDKNPHHEISNTGIESDVDLHVRS